MSISLQRGDPTGDEPLSLLEVKNFLKVDATDTTDDDLISGLITAARERSEFITGRCIVGSPWTYYVDSLPYGWQENTGSARNTINRFVSWWANNQVLRLPMAPLQSVTSLKYIPDYGSDYVTLDSSFYTVDTASSPGCIYPASNYYWPFTWTVKNAVKIDYVAGYDVVPETIKTAIRLMICDWYEQRGDSPSTATNTAASLLLRPYRCMSVGYIDR